MKLSKPFNVNELIQNESFVQWIKTNSAESDDYWKAYLRRNPDQENNIRLAAQFIRAIILDKEYVMDQKELDQLKVNIEFRKIHKTTIQKNWNRKFLYWGVAAGLLLLLTFYTGFTYWMNRQATSMVSNIPSMIEKRAEFGQKLTISLPDGTLVKLNAGSSIAYPAEFSSNKREVRFSGEGFFEVAKDAAKPFIIKSDGFFTKVLGTSFNLKSYPEEGKINVAVVAGKVEIVQPAGTSLLLLPNEMGEFDPSKKQFTKHFYDANEVLAWQDGILNFNKMALPEVLNELEKWYGVKFMIDKDVRLNGDFSGRFQNANLEQVLEGIRFTSDKKFHYTIEDKRVYLTTE